MEHSVAISLSLAMASLAAAAAFAVPRPEAPEIVMPRAHEVIHSNTGVVPVVVINVPSGVQLQPVLDGTRMPLQDQAAFELHGVVRGNHSLAVRLLDARHRVLAHTPTVVFHVWHASRL